MTWRDLRASDADRDRVLVLLAEAVSDGRLTMEEHAERVQRACTARTLGAARAAHAFAHLLDTWHVAGGDQLGSCIR